MSLDIDRVQVSAALRLAKEKYSDDTYNHVLRVMQYVADNDMIPYDYREDCISLAIMHDLVEDTDYLGGGLPDNFHKALMLLTKSNDIDYIDYIKNFKGYTSYTWGKCAWWVKLADMKDHLSQKDTLTDKLRDKYLKALPYLL